MSLQKFLSADDLNNYKSWPAALEPLVYEQWVPSDDYTTLTLQQTFENGTILDQRTYTVIAPTELKEFYDNYDDDEEVACELPQTETETISTATLAYGDNYTTNENSQYYLPNLIFNHKH